VKQVLLVRHGQTELNRAGALRGRLDVALTDRGRWEARQLAKRIAADYRVDAIITSPLQRALQTAAPVGQATGVTPEPHDAVIDVDYGTWAGRSMDAFDSNEQKLLAAWHRDPTVPLPGAEHPQVVQDRACDFLASLARSSEKCVVVVTHDAILQLVLCHVLQIPLSNYQRLVQHTATLNEIRRQRGPWRVTLLDSSWHLELNETGSPTTDGTSRSGVRLIEISAGAIVRARGKILVLQTLAGDWVLPKGKLEAGEAPAAAAVREAWEEAGLRATVVKRLESTRYTRELADRPVEKTVHWFLMEATDTRIQAAAHEFQLAEWVTAEEAASRLRWDEQRKLVTNLVALEAVAI